MLAVFASPAFTAERLVGTASIWDGDSLRLNGRKVRLHGVDAPETDQVCIDGKASLYSCGTAARDFLAQLVGSSTIICSGSEYDRNHRLIAICHFRKIDLSAEMVRAGWGLAYVRYSKDYIFEETVARSRMVGMWAGAFFAPWEWRQRNLKTEVLATNIVPINAQKLLLDTLKPYRPLVPGCEIKGIVSKKTNGFIISQMTEIIKRFGWIARSAVGFVLKMRLKSQGGEKQGKRTEGSHGALVDLQLKHYKL